MSQVKSEGIVLRGVDFSDTSRIVTFVTPLRGRLTCIAKGARRKGSPFAGALDTFNRVDLVCYAKKSRSVQTLGEVAVLDTFHDIKQNLESSVYAALALEIVERTVHEDDPSNDLYETLVRGLHGWGAWDGEARTYISWLSLQLLRAAGFAPQLEYCVHCGAPAKDAARFDFAGGITCASCPSSRRVTESTLTVLRAMQSENDACPNVTEQEAQANSSAEVFSLLRHYASHQLETDFRCIRVIEDMFGSGG